MGDNGRIVDDAHQRGTQRYERELVNPYGGREPVGGDDQLVVDEPKANSLADNYHRRGNDKVKREVLGENPRRPAGVATPQGHVEETLRGVGQRRAEEYEHQGQTAHNVVNTEVLDAQFVQKHARGEQRDNHEEQHPHV